jgi:hypothetical protein
MAIPDRYLVFLGLALALVLPSGAHAQEEESEGAVWRLEELHHGFCVEFLIDPSALTEELPDGYSPVRASQLSDPHPALRSVIEGQPEYASWTPSRLCLYYFGAIDAAGRRIRESNPRKAPMFGFWTVAAATAGPGKPQEFALAVLTTHGRVENAANLAGLELRRVKSTVAPVPPDENGVSSGEDRHEIRIGGTRLIWDGRPGSDSSRVEGEMTLAWTARGRRGGRVNGKTMLAADWTRAMVGSLKVEGKDKLARLLRASPTRFVGPAYYGGAGTVTFSR